MFSGTYNRQYGTGTKSKFGGGLYGHGGGGASLFSSGEFKNRPYTKQLPCFN